VAQPAPTNPDRRLDSWKEIAAFFGRDERTVRRWEKESALPVHRVPGGARGRVFAYEAELGQWLSTPQAVESAIGTPASPVDQIQTGHKLISLRPAAKLVAGAVLCAATVAGILAYRKNHSFSVRASEAAAARTQGRSRPATPEAEQLYLKGRYYWNKRTPDDLNKALDYFMQAIVHDPNYSQAYVGMADCYNLMREYTLMPSSEAYPRAFAAAKKAVELDDQSSEAHASLAFVSFFGMWNLATGEREFRRAIDLNPNIAAPHQWYANALFALHRFPEALAQMDRAQALDPASTSILADKGNILFRAGQSEEALALLKQMEIREPAFRSPHGYLKEVYLDNRDYPNYLSEMRQEALLVHDDSQLAMEAAAEKGFAAGGARGLFEAMLLTQKKLYTQHSLRPTELARTSAVLGHKDEALRYLKDACEQRDGEILFLETFSEFNTLHDDPAYHDLLARMNLPVQNTPWVATH
jgi:tetratricopeptide (TPR) repeat protein